MGAVDGCECRRTCLPLILFRNELLLHEAEDLIIQVRGSLHNEVRDAFTWKASGKWLVCAAWK